MNGMNTNVKWQRSVSHFTDFVTAPSPRLIALRKLNASGLPKLKLKKKKQMDGLHVPVLDLIIGGVAQLKQPCPSHFKTTDRKIIMKKKHLEALNYYMDILEVHVSDDDNYEMRQHIKSEGMKKPINKALKKLASKLSET
jgi:hypothetical protein